MASPCTSAYKQLQGSEPAFTNWARTARDSSDFVACLDYIFLHPPEAITTTEVLELPATVEAASVPGPYPVRSEPSDHVMIAASVLVKDVVG